MKPAEHNHKADILLWSVDTDLKVSAPISLATDTAQKVAKLCVNLRVMSVS